MSGQHRLERRARLLASRIDAAGRGLGSILGGRPFTDAKTRSAALDWWSQHRTDQYGAEVLRQMDPVQIADLDAALYAHVNQQEVPRAEG